MTIDFDDIDLDAEDAPNWRSIDRYEDEDERAKEREVERGIEFWDETDTLNPHAAPREGEHAELMGVGRCLLSHLDLKHRKAVFHDEEVSRYVIPISWLDAGMFVTPLGPIEDADYGDRDERDN